MTTVCSKVKSGLWPNVTSSRPCPICKKPDWCRTDPDGDWAACYRVADGRYRSRAESDGKECHIHRLTPFPPGVGEPQFSLQDGGGKLADDETLDLVYRSMLKAMALSAEHRESLERRGLLNPVRYGYRTLTTGRAGVCRRLIAAGLEKHLPTVPGFYIAEKDGQKYWSIAGYGGIVGPILNEQKLIVALRVRLDGNPKDGKYRSLSSKKRGGPGPGSPVHFPAFGKASTADRSTVRITEGALKAEIATQLSGIYTIGLPSVASWKLGAKAAQRAGAKVVRVAFDADARTNRHVAAALANLVSILVKKKFTVELEVWDAAKGKGIDDLLAAGHQPEVVTGDAVEAAVEEAEAKEIIAAMATDPPPGCPMPPPGAGPGECSLTGACENECIDDPSRLAREWVDAYADHTHRPTVLFHRERWWRWVQDRWRETADSEMESEVARGVKAIINRDYPGWHPPRPARNGGEPAPPPPPPKVTRSLISNVLLAIRAHHTLASASESPCWLDDPDRHRNFLATRNGLLDIDSYLSRHTDPLRTHTPNWFSPVCLPYDFDPKADCPKWRGVLQRNLGDDPAKQLLLQQWFGYLLTADCSQQRWMEMYGDGANGKSVVLAVIEGTLGAENCSAVGLEQFGDKFQLIATLGKLVNIAAEVGELDKAAEGVLKAFVVGDPVNFEQKFKPAFRARPTARLVLATNNPPVFSDKTDGIFRRRILLPFTIQIPEAERIQGMDKAGWWERQGELSGILNWSLVGLHLLRQAGRFTIPTSCQVEMDRFRLDSDSARRFLVENYVEGEGEVGKQALYHEYRQWCVNRGLHHLGDIMFGRALRRLFKNVKDGKTTDREGKRVNAHTGLVALEDREI